MFGAWEKVHGFRFVVGFEVQAELPLTFLSCKVRGKQTRASRKEKVSCKQGVRVCYGKERNYIDESRSFLGTLAMTPHYPNDNGKDTLDTGEKRPWGPSARLSASLAGHCLPSHSFLALFLTSCVISGTLLTLSEPWLPWVEGICCF